MFVGNLFHPINHFTVDLFLNSDVRHGRVWCRAMPMLLPRQETDDVTGESERKFRLIRVGFKPAIDDGIGGASGRACLGLGEADWAFLGGKGDADE